MRFPHSKPSDVPSKKWYKYENGNGCYYSHNPNKFDDRSVAGDGSRMPTPKEALDHMLALKPNGNGTIEFNDGVFSVRREKPASVCELPSGTYYYKCEDYPHPDRLVPTDFRSDHYVEMPQITTNIMKDVNCFLDNRQVYQDLKIIYKTGFLLYGVPGTGKTALIRHLVRTQFPKDTITIVITKWLPSNEILENLKETTGDRLKVFILEEFTGFTQNEFDMEGILNFLDGEQSIDNSLFFCSTNYPEILPHTIVARHSRIEYLHKIDVPDHEERKKLLGYYLKREMTDEEVKLTEKMTADNVKEICLLCWTKKLTLEEAIKAVKDHLAVAKNAFKGKNIKLGI